MTTLGSIIGGGLWLATTATAAPTDPLTETELRWMVTEIVPVVEDVTGREFDEVPELVVADEAMLGEVIFEEQVHLLSGVNDLTTDEARQAARRTSADVAHVFAGKYGFLDKKLYLSLEGIRLSLLERGAEPWLIRPMVRLVVAHELTHALQDQHADLGDVVSEAEGNDAIMAANCTVEGHAVWVHEQVADRMGLDEARELMSEMLGFDEPIRRRMDPDRFYTAYVYGLGRDFIAWHAEHGGPDKVWSVIADPPVETRTIASPSAWEGDARVRRLDPAARKAIRRARRRLAGRGWRPDESAMGDFDVRDQLVRAGADTRIADDLDEAWNLRAVGGDMLGLEIQFLRFKSPGGASAYVGDMRDRADAQARAVAVDPFIHAEATEFDLVDSDRSAREAITVSFFEGDHQQLGTIWVARGTDVVQVVMVNARPPDRRLAWAIDRVFRGVQPR